MPQIFEEHDGIVKEKTAEYQKALKLRRERFLEELEAYNHQVNWNICMIVFKILGKQNRKKYLLATCNILGRWFLYLWKCRRATKIYEEGPNFEHQAGFMQRKDRTGMFKYKPELKWANY